MSEAAAPAAPTAPTTSTPAPTNGAPAGATQAPATKPPPRPVPPAPKPATGRSNNGQFLPRDGTVGTSEGEGKPPPGASQAAKEEWRFQERLKVFGEDEEVSYSKEEVTRRLQKLRALEKKHLAEYASNDEKARRVLELAKTDPAAFMRELGQDPDAYARKRLAEEARLGAMTEEEKAIHERDQKIAAFEAKEKAREEESRAQQAKAKHERMVGGFKAKLTPALAALKEMGIPDDHDTLGALVETLKATLEPGVNLSDITPQELAQEAVRKLDANAERFLARLDGPALVKRLGPARIALILEASLADFEKSQNFEEPRERRPVEPMEHRERTAPIDGREVDRRLAALRRGK